MTYQKPVKIGDAFVHKSGTMYEGDWFALKDIDGDEPTGEYQIRAIREQLFECSNGGQFKRVHVMNQHGQWTNAVNICRVRRSR